MSGVYVLEVWPGDVFLMWVWHWVEYVFRVCFWWAESGAGGGGVVLKVWSGCDLGWFFDVSVVLGGVCIIVLVLLVGGVCREWCLWPFLKQKAASSRGHI